MLRSLSLVILSVQATFAAVQYAVPKVLVAHVASAACTLPEGFALLNFVAESQDGGKTLQAFDFGYVDRSTNITTPCHFNSTSAPIKIPGRPTLRYACDNTLVEFIYQNGTITMIEAACPDVNGSNFEASGAATVALNCNTTTTCGMCKAVNGAIATNFTSLEPASRG